MDAAGALARREERLLHGDRLQGPRAHLGRDLAAERVVASAAERAVHESSEAVEASVEARARLLHAEEASDELSGVPLTSGSGARADPEAAPPGSWVEVKGAWGRGR